MKNQYVYLSLIGSATVPNTRKKYLLKTKCLDFFSLQATAVDRCAVISRDHVTFKLTYDFSNQMKTHNEETSVSLSRKTRLSCPVGDPSFNLLSIT